jgi:hypothetical protein
MEPIQFYFEQTGGPRPMSMAHWYHQKAEQCLRMAKEASEPHRRAGLKSERQAWLELAASIEQDDLARFGPEPGSR